MQTGMIVLLGATTGLAALAAQSAAPALAPLLTAALPWMMALTALPMVVTVAARPLDVSLLRLGQAPLSGLPRVGFLATKLTLVTLMAMVAAGQF
ncbi:hypothetical protein [Szabonella alba]|uniref:Uncharacterized protein n=1 Tax=Szabonella alba TaxID=2804194 RepID=A0A8K0V633_9RHOB|nr:hypothetical protein [Szabonella alba]MBL4915851.1 hypothetical protein [Szabonella alba]